jgi:hypothetical protein
MDEFLPRKTRKKKDDSQIIKSESRKLKPLQKRLRPEKVMANAKSQITKWLDFYREIRQRRERELGRRSAPSLP